MTSPNIYIIRTRINDKERFVGEYGSIVNNYKPALKFTSLKTAKIAKRNYSRKMNRCRQRGVEFMEFKIAKFVPEKSLSGGELFLLEVYCGKLDKLKLRDETYVRVSWNCQ